MFCKIETVAAMAAAIAARQGLTPVSPSGALKPLAMGGGRNNQAGWHYPTLPPPPLLAPEFLSSRVSTATWNVFQTPFL